MSRKPLLNSKSSASATNHPSERRKSERRPYPVVARYTPCPGGELPEPLLFREMLCRDISRDGISFYVDQPIAADTVAIELGEPPQRTRMLARIAHQLPATVVNLYDNDAEFPEQFVVGCEFVRRLVDADQA